MQTRDASFTFLCLQYRLPIIYEPYGPIPVVFLLFVVAAGIAALYMYYTVGPFDCFYLCWVTEAVQCACYSVQPQVYSTSLCSGL